MGVFEQFPYTNFHGVNLDWILKMVREHETRITALESWKVVTDGRLDSLENRMDSAESDISALDSRMDTAESDIDALESRVDSAGSDIDALETRMDTAENDIDNLTPYYVDISDDNMSAPAILPIKQAYNKGRPIYLRWTSGGVNPQIYFVPMYGIFPPTESVARGTAYFADSHGEIGQKIGVAAGQTNIAGGPNLIQLNETNNGTKTWTIFPAKGQLIVNS